MDDTMNDDPLAAVVRALKPLESAERQRTITAALLYLGESPLPTVEASVGSVGTETSDMGGDYPSKVGPWLKQNNVTPDELDQVFHFGTDGSFDIHDAPGKSKKNKTLNTYILTGLGSYLATGERTFDDEVARKFCQTIGCYDAANHSTHLKNYKGPEFTGNKNKGLEITNPGIKKGAALVKELAGTTQWSMSAVSS